MEIVFNVASQLPFTDIFNLLHNWNVDVFPWEDYTSDQGVLSVIRDNMTEVIKLRTKRNNQVTGDDAA